MPQEATRTSDANFGPRTLAGRPSADTAFELVSDAQHWAALLAEVPFPHSVQSHTYGAAKAGDAWHVAQFLVRHAGRPVGIVQALEKRMLGFRLATRINRGPMFFEPEPPREEITAVYRAIRNRWGRLSKGVLSIAPALFHGEAGHQIMTDAGFRRRKCNPWGSARIDLTAGIDAVFSGLDSGWRNRIRAGERAGVTVRVSESADDFEWMIARHVENMREKTFGAHGTGFLRALQRNSKGDVLLFQAVHEDKPVAGLVVIKVGGLADGVVAWFGPEARRVKAGNLLVWRGIEEMHRRGCTSYDVGGTNSDQGFATFKAGLRGTRYMLLGEYVSLF